jgi:hypothetical protein
LKKKKIHYDVHLVVGEVCVKWKEHIKREKKYEKMSKRMANQLDEISQQKLKLSARASTTNGNFFIFFFCAVSCDVPSSSSSTMMMMMTRCYKPPLFIALTLFSIRQGT